MFQINKVRFFIMLAALCAGICIGAASAAQISRPDADALFASVSADTPSAVVCKESFIKALWQNGGSVALLCVFGTTLLCIPAAAVLLGVRGYTLGYAVGALVAQFGFRGFLASLGGILPHNLIYVPCLLALSLIGARFSARLMQHHTDVWRLLPGYAVSVLFFACITLVGCLAEGYISAPILYHILNAAG